MCFPLFFMHVQGRNINNNILLIPLAMQKYIESVVESFFDNMPEDSDFADDAAEEATIWMYKELVERNARLVLDNYDFGTLKFAPKAPRTIFNGHQLLLNGGMEYDAANVAGHDVGIVTIRRIEKKASQEPQVELAALWCILGHHITHVIDPDETWTHVYVNDSILGMLPDAEPVVDNPKYQVWNDGSDMCELLINKNCHGLVVRVRAYRQDEGSIAIKADAIFPIQVFGAADKGIEKMQEALDSNPLI